MRFLAEWVMRGRMTAVMLTAVTLVASMMLPPLSYLSGAAVGLVTLRMGLAQGLLVAGLAMVATALLAHLLTGSLLLGVAAFVSLWLPVALAAEQLRRHPGLQRPLWLLGGLSAALLALLYLLLGDPAVWWRGVLGELLAPMLSEAPPPPGATEADVELLLDEMAGLMSGALSAALLVSSSIALLLARWWQSQLYNPGGFGAEFRALRLGRGASLAVFLLVLVGNVLEPTEAVMRELLLPLLALYMLQGLAVIHAVVKAREASAAWLVPVYGLMLFALPPTALTLALAGWMDNWMDFRALLARKSAEQ